MQEPHLGRTSGWNAAHYLKYGDERTRAAVDLAARIKLDAPVTVVDLGCGPGNSTQVLRGRWPSSVVIGIDNSVDMIAAARKAFPDDLWELANISDWAPQRVRYSYASRADGKVLFPFRRTFVIAYR